jgi:hypothetical protein
MHGHGKRRACRPNPASVPGYGGEVAGRQRESNHIQS